MRIVVREKLDKIFAYPFFGSVGEKLPSTVTPVRTWKVAVKECSRQKWGNCRLMARNTIQRRVEDQYPKPGMWERLQEWNPLADETKPLIDSFLDRLMPTIPVPDEFKVEIRQNLQYDIFYACLECQLSDISEPVFFLKHLDAWYAAGRFPCGWDGEEFPERWDGDVGDGKLMVF